LVELGKGNEVAADVQADAGIVDGDAVDGPGNDVAMRVGRWEN